MTISELLSDDKWEKISFFLQSRGIELVDQLEESVIEELYFVPGADYEFIEELKQKIAFVNEKNSKKVLQKMKYKSLARSQKKTKSLRKL
ncbi:hypothetical protein ACMUW0_001977 [Enterococcus hirae]|nr:hypothetical protein [Enterococcus hirae]